MDIMVNPAISLLDQAKIQAQVLVPVLNALREELGAERANQIVSRALRDWSRDMYLKIGASIPGRPKEKWAAMNAAGIPRIGKDIDVQVLRQEADSFDLNVTGCRFADFFRQLGEPDLGALLLCEADFHMVEVGSPEVELTRTQTIMKGASYCDFRYRMNSGERS
jgi:hypothetical protein